MHVVVVGCGRVGSELAADASSATATPWPSSTRTRDAFRRLPEDFAGRTVRRLRLRPRPPRARPASSEAGAVAAVTSGDNSNILTARIARETFEIERVVARIYDPRRAVIYQRLGIPTVATVSWTTDQVLRRLLPAEEQPHDWIDPSGKRRAWSSDRSRRSGRARSSRGSTSPACFRLIAVTRLGAAQIEHADLVGQEGDVLHFVADVIGPRRRCAPGSSTERRHH